LDFLFSDVELPTPKSTFQYLFELPEHPWHFLSFYLFQFSSYSLLFQQLLGHPNCQISTF